ncbi:c-type cytochrome [Campylobacter sp. CX2-8023-23]|uniref:c-type cytochrome n=1 Tax=Campylobacter porcelli TaxID=1660073 RepID=UPI002EC6BA96|nr:c-type cytochrome [Campylobacter sp. CX2-8023-23]
MKFITFFLIFTTFAFSSEFITKNEYAKMLYKNPRGIGCNKCHGDKGEGALIVKYKAFNKKSNKYEERSLKAPRINNLDFDRFKSAVTDSKGIMPSYFLTQNEILNLFEYITSFNKDKKDEK